VGNADQEKALRILEAALDLRAPVVRHRLKKFPEGAPFLWLSFPGAGGAAIFLDRRQWIYLSEPKRGEVAVQLAAGQVDDDPALVSERLLPVMTPVRRRRSAAVRVLAASGIGLAAGAGVGLLSAVLMAILVAGNGYLSDTSTVVVYALAALLGVASGLWLAWRWWRLG
jgi:hypothetical protein